MNRPKEMTILRLAHPGRVGTGDGFEKGGGCMRRCIFPPPNHKATHPRINSNPPSNHTNSIHRIHLFPWNRYVSPPECLCGTTAAQDGTGFCLSTLLAGACESRRGRVFFFSYLKNYRFCNNHIFFHVRKNRTMEILNFRQFSILL